MPLAFISHAVEDEALAARIARDLAASGIDCFFAPWEIRAGESIRQRIDDGIGACTHFVVLMTPSSIDKNWVNAEIDAGFDRQTAGRCRIIVLRAGIALDQLPPLLRPQLSPSVDDYDAAMPSLISGVWGVTVRPPLVPTPSFISQAIAPRSGLSIGAGLLVQFLVANTATARAMDPQVSVGELRMVVNLPDDDLIEIVDELESRDHVSVSRALGAGPLGFVALYPTARLFAEMDVFFMPWDPEQDAKTIASHLVSEPEGAVIVQLLVAKLGWTPRRMNPATTRLVVLGAADPSNSIDPDFEHQSLRRNAATRRLLRDQ